MRWEVIALVDPGLPFVAAAIVRQTRPTSRFPFASSGPTLTTWRKSVVLLAFVQMQKWPRYPWRVFFDRARNLAPCLP